MRQAKWESLEEKIIRPGMEKYLMPLLMYRGQQNVGRIHRLWNFAITCMEHEVESYSQAVKLSHNPDFAHLCGPYRPVQMFTMYGLFGRLIDNPRVTDNISGFTDYVNNIRGMKFTPTPVSTHIKNFEPGHLDRYAPWRAIRVPSDLPDGTLVEAGEDAAIVIDGHYELTVRQMRDNPAWRALGLVGSRKRAGARTPAAVSQKPDAPFYPYLVHNPGDPIHSVTLSEAISKSVPHELPPDARADICHAVAMRTFAEARQRAAA